MHSPFVAENSRVQLSKQSLPRELGRTRRFLNMPTLAQWAPSVAQTLKESANDDLPSTVAGANTCCACPGQRMRKQQKRPGVMALRPTRFLRFLFSKDLLFGTQLVTWPASQRQYLGIYGPSEHYCFCNCAAETPSPATFARDWTHHRLVLLTKY